MMPGIFRDDISNGSEVYRVDTTNRQTDKVTDTADNNTTLATLRCTGGNKNAKYEYTLGQGCPTFLIGEPSVQNQLVGSRSKCQRRGGGREWGGVSLSPAHQGAWRAS